jgi:DNA (cytosine-5)-methyltransferase 1
MGEPAYASGAERVLYTDADPAACAWLGELVRQGHLVGGRVLPRDIHHLRGSDLDGYRRVHLFAGLGGWELALQLAAWPDDLPIWTGSCPCQPFSAAGRGRGADDPRHLWPEMRRLVAECRPPIVAGEQVASPAGRAWLAVVRADLEALGYRVGAADLCAAGVGAPHIRQRLFWVAERVADADGEGRALSGRSRAGRGAGSRHRGAAGGLVQPDGAGSQPGRPAAAADGHGRAAEPAGRGDRAGADHGGWASADWLRCRDGHWRPVEAGAFPLADGLPAGVGPLRAGLARVGLPPALVRRALRELGAYLARARAYRTCALRGYGNAIVPQVAAEFLCAYLDTRAAA